MPPKKNLVGQRFGRWLVLSEVIERRHGKILWNCVCDCGTTGQRQTTHFTSGKSTSCGCRTADRMRGQTRENNPAWKGGRHITDEGYVHVFDPEHPNAKASGYIYEHRKVMSDLLGRKLLKEETVHHIDGDRQNNEPSNLELWSTSHPRGQRVEDKIEWAKELLELYKDWSRG